MSGRRWSPSEFMWLSPTSMGANRASQASATSLVDLLYPETSSLGSRFGGASSSTTWSVGTKVAAWAMISDCNSFVWSIVSRCLLFVCRASFVRVAMMIMSVGLNVVCVILLRVCTSWYVL